MVRFGTNTQKTSEPAWQDVGANVLRMDSLYDASFHDWLKCEDNVSIIASYLQRIANEYPMDRIINALRWLVSSWRVESTAVIVRHITADWVVSANAKPSPSAPFRLDVPQPSSHQPEPAVLSGETRRGLLVRELTKDWTCQQIAQLVGMMSLTFWSERPHLEIFLRTLVSDWDFCRLSSFFSYISGQLGLDYRFKVSMLQQAARRNSSRLSLKRARNGVARKSGVAASESTSIESEDGSNKRVRHEPADFSTTSEVPAATAVGAAASEENQGDDAGIAARATTLVTRATSACSGDGSDAVADSDNDSAHMVLDSSTAPAAQHSSFSTHMDTHNSIAVGAMASSASTHNLSSLADSVSASEPSSLSTRVSQSSHIPPPLHTSCTSRTSQSAATAVSSTTPSSPALPPPSVRRPSVQDTSALGEEADSEELQLSTFESAISSSRCQHLSPQPQQCPAERESDCTRRETSPSSSEAVSQQQQRRRPRNNTTRSPTMLSTSSPLVSGTFSEQEASSDFAARRPLTPQIASTAYVANPSTHPSSPTLCRRHRHNRSYQNHDCVQPLTPAHSSSSLVTMATAAADSATLPAGSSSSRVTVAPSSSRPPMRLHAASISSAGEPQPRLGGGTTSRSSSESFRQLAAENVLALDGMPGDQSAQPSAQQHAEQQQHLDFRTRTSSEGELGQFEGAASTHLALPLPSESVANAPSLCGRTSASAYDVLGIVMADSDHQIAGSSA
ncbi:hypothetical protein H4S08_000461 [Coemansia sp. RSA 1365]|nr:hypothetical protein H4S08_000461 [Coemansia sp. RSA 1365]